MSDKQVVLAVFDDEAAADAAVNQVKSWDKATDEIKLSSIGVLAPEEQATMIKDKLAELGGNAEAHDTEEVALEEAAKEIPAEATSP